MIRVCLQTVGLDAQVAQRVRLAGKLLAGYGFGAEVKEWDGSPCQLLLAFFGDARARAVADAVQQRGIAVLALLPKVERETDTHHASISAEGTAASLASLLQRLLSEAAPVSAGTNDDAQARALPVSVARERRSRARGRKNSALSQLATDLTLRSRDLRATIRGRTIGIHPLSGRVSANSLSDLLAARDLLGEAGWQFDPQPLGTDSLVVGDVWASLDTFYVIGALRFRQTLPAFANDAMELCEWPDLGAAPEAVVALHVAQALRKPQVAWRSLAQASRLPMADFNACLWAFAASNLLVINRITAKPAVTSTPQHRVASNLLAKLAQRFGLAWRPA